MSLPATRQCSYWLNVRLQLTAMPQVALALGLGAP